MRTREFAFEINWPLTGGKRIPVTFWAPKATVFTERMSYQESAIFLANSCLDIIPIIVNSKVCKLMSCEESELCICLHLQKCPIAVMIEDSSNVLSSENDSFYWKDELPRVSHLFGKFMFGRKYIIQIILCKIMSCEESELLSILKQVNSLFYF